MGLKVSALSRAWSPPPTGADLALLWHGAMPSVLDRPYAPSTVGAALAESTVDRKPAVIPGAVSLAALAAPAARAILRNWPRR